MISFGICTIDGNEKFTEELIYSIVEQEIPEFEIIIIGGKLISKFSDSNNINFVNFDESVRPGWITKKKNMITNLSKYETIVFLHDYLKLDKDWYKGFLKYDQNFNILTNKILRKNGDRYLDWTLWEVTKTRYDFFTLYERECLLPYDVKNLSKFMYISGAYFIAKRKVMLEFPLDESLSWKEGEDVEWSLRVRDKYSFEFNENATTLLQIAKTNYPYKESSRNLISKLNKIKDQQFYLSFDKFLYEPIYTNFFKLKNLFLKILKRVNILLSNI
jgi:hypothetical protein